MRKIIKIITKIVIRLILLIREKIVYTIRIIIVGIYLTINYIRIIIVGIYLTTSYIFKFQIEPIIQITELMIHVIRLSLIEIISIIFRPVLFLLKQNANLIMETFEKVFKLFWNRFLILYAMNSIFLLKMAIDLLGTGYINPVMSQVWFMDLLRWLVCFDVLKRLIPIWPKNEPAAFESFHSRNIFFQDLPGSWNWQNILFSFAGVLKSRQLLLGFFQTYGITMLVDFRTSGLLRLPEGSGAVLLFGISQFLLSVVGFVVFSWNRRRGWNFIDKRTGILSTCRYELRGSEVIQFPIKDIVVIFVKKTDSHDQLFLKTLEDGRLALTLVNSGEGLIEKGRELSKILNVGFQVI